MPKRPVPIRSQIPTVLGPSVAAAALPPVRVTREFVGRLDAGAKLLPAGNTRSRPRRLLSLGYEPRFKVELFGVSYYLADVRQNEDIRFFVAYVVLPGAERRIYPRIFYKDISLVWRSASHYARSEHENWIGKGDVTVIVRDGVEMVESAEETTDLPLEIQTTLEKLSSQAEKIVYDDKAVARILRRGPDDRVEPYRDFTDPRRRAQADPRNLVNHGRPIARFTRKNDPTSLRFAKGFEPDFRDGIIERSVSKSRMYHGRLRRFRIASRNQRVQYLFFAGRRQVWIGALQTTTTELSSFGLRTIDVDAPEELLLPGYEYHFLDEAEDPPEFISQIPKGFAGPSSKVDPVRADTSRWLDQVPVIQAFRREVLGRR
ncbi:MAG: hypothetical protein GY723_06595 [bacterium]|nr:hypothetical protein [bacterium]